MEKEQNIFRAEKSAEDKLPIDPEEKIEAEKVEKIRQAMEKAIEKAHSEEEAIKLVKEVIPKGEQFMGPLVTYMEHKDGEKSVRNIQAQILLGGRNKDYTIDAYYHE